MTSANERADEDTFQAAHDWEHQDNVSKRQDGRHVLSACDCGCVLYAQVVARRIVRTSATADTRYCPKTGRDHR